MFALQKWLTTAPLALVAPTLDNWLVGLAIGVLLLLIFLVVLGRPSLTSSRASLAPPTMGLRQQASRWTSHLPFLGSSRFRLWEERLRLAGAPFTPAELYAVALGLSIAGFALLQSALGYTLLSIFLGVIAAVMPFQFINWRAQRNRRLLNLQIEALCLDLAGAAESGFSKMQLLEQAAEAEAPLGPYFAEVLAERDQGVSSLDALENLQRRLSHPQINGLIQALQIHFERGAPVAPLLRAAAEEIRIEDELIIELQTRLEQPRVQFWFVCLLSIPVLLYMRWQDPTAVDGLLGNPIGQIYYLILWGLALFLYFIVRTITNIERL